MSGIEAARSLSGVPCALAAALLLAACSEPLATELEPAAAVVGGAGFTDTFDNLNLERWLPSSHLLGRGYLLPENVSVAAGVLRLATRFDQYTGAELSSLDRHGTGIFSATLRCASPPGTLCAFFLYQTGVGNLADEIDVEVLPGTSEIMFTIWVAGRRTQSARLKLGFNPAVGFHTYAIERTTNELRFRVDGALKKTFRGRSKLPQAPMPVFLNSWWPTWLTPVNADGVLEVDQVTVR